MPVGAAAIRLNPLQRQLERIYEVEVPHDVDDFLTSDRDLLHELAENGATLDTSEQLLVCEDGDYLDISLYIDYAVVERLADDDPTVHLHGGNLNDFCTVLEGVSHFLYLTWNAGFERQVSLLELELQAEVDKYITSTFLFGLQGEGKVPTGLAEWLFENPSFEESLEPQARRRYEDANYYAGRFCAELEERFLRGRRAGGLVNELRRFYRLTQRQKISRIESAPLTH